LFATLLQPNTDTITTAHKPLTIYNLLFIHSYLSGFGYMGIVVDKPQGGKSHLSGVTAVAVEKPFKADR